MHMHPDFHLDLSKKDNQIKILKLCKNEEILNGDQAVFESYSAGGATLKKKSRKSKKKKSRKSKKKKSRKSKKKKSRKSKKKRSRKSKKKK